MKNMSDFFRLNGKDFIQEMYRVTLGREADPAGIRHYLDVLERGGGKSAVFYDLAASSEAKLRTFRENPLKASTNDAFITAAYLKALGRRPDPTGRKTYLEKLKTNSRVSILREIQSSPEGRAHQALEKFKATILRQERLKRSMFGWLGRGARLERAINRIEFRSEMFIAEFGTTIQHAVGHPSYRTEIASTPQVRIAVIAEGGSSNLSHQARRVYGQLKTAVLLRARGDR